MIIEYQKKNILIKLFLIFSFCICWLSISTTLDDFLIFKNDGKLNIKSIINFFRQALIYFCLVLSCIIILFSKKKFFKKEKLIYVIFGIYFLAQIPGLIYSENKFENIYLSLSSLTAILTIILIEDFFSKDEQKIFLYISFLIFLILFLISLIPQLKLYFEGRQYFYGSLQVNSEVFLGKDSPRSSGSARTCLLLIIILFILENNLFKKKKFFVRPFIIFLLSIILLFQSRTIIAISIIIFSLIFIYENDFSLKKILSFVTFYFIFPILLFIFFINIYAHQNFELRKNLQKLNKPFLTNKIEKNLEVRKLSDFSSGRFNDWNEIYKKFSVENIFFGYGSQADRFLINQNASNGLIYAISSSGIFGTIFFVFFSLIVLQKISRYIIFFKQTDINYYFMSLIILTIFLRSMLETSYSVYSIDFMILITSILLINNMDHKH